MKYVFQILKPIDVASAVKIFSVLETSDAFQSIGISFDTGHLEITSEKPVTIQQVETLLADIKDIKILEMQ